MLFLRQSHFILSRRLFSTTAVRTRHSIPFLAAFATTNNAASSSFSSMSSSTLVMLATATATATTLATIAASSNTCFIETQCENPAYNNANYAATAQCEKLGEEPAMLSPHTEPATGILFPSLCNGMNFVGCGVRVKWGFVKVYAVGTYVDPLAMSVVKSSGKEEEVKKALLDPNYPRTIRIVMNRNLSIDKFTSGIIESLEPRMKKIAPEDDLSSLEEFKKLNPPVDLIKGAEMEMTIRGDTLLYKNAVGGLGQIKSRVFTEAMCDVYYGGECVSPSHLEEVLKGIKGL